jgi:hypothetical protein
MTAPATGNATPEIRKGTYNSTGQDQGNGVVERKMRVRSPTVNRTATPTITQAVIWAQCDLISTSLSSPAPHVNEPQSLSAEVWGVVGQAGQVRSVREDAAGLSGAGSFRIGGVAPLDTAGRAYEVPCLQLWSPGSAGGPR